MLAQLEVNPFSNWLRGLSISVTAVVIRLDKMIVEFSVGSSHVGINKLLIFIRFKLLCIFL